MGLSRKSVGIEFRVREEQRPSLVGGGPLLNSEGCIFVGGELGG